MFVSPFSKKGAFVFYMISNRIKIKFVFLSALLISTFLLIGCTASHPRFKSREEPHQPENKISKEHRFSSDVQKEETTEDDRKVDINSIRENIAKNNLDKSVRQKVILDVLSMIGTPYSMGGRDGKGIDCSGFSKKIYESSFGIQLPSSTEEQFKLGKSIEKENLEFGDLVFFNTTGKTPSHVGIYLGDFLFAHASVSYGVTISSLLSSYYKKRYVGARRILD